MAPARTFPNRTTPNLTTLAYPNPDPAATTTNPIHDVHHHRSGLCGGTIVGSPASVAALPRTVALVIAALPCTVALVITVIPVITVILRTVVRITAILPTRTAGHLFARGLSR
jgi:hypothetical protein